MNIVKAGYEIYPTAHSTEMLKKVEKIARVCYKSEDKIAEGTAERMINALVNNKHYAMLEHGSIIIEMNRMGYRDLTTSLTLIREEVGEVPYIRYTPEEYSGRCIVSGNFRAWLEFLELCIEHKISVSNDLLNILLQDKYSPVFSGIREIERNLIGWHKEVEATELNYLEMLIHLDLSVKFIVDRGVSHEIVRHRKASFAQESTRYCNYGSKGGEITVIEPCYFEDDSVERDNWEISCMTAEKIYLYLLEKGKTPQEARAVLPTSLKTEVVMTANLKEWRHFFGLRALGTTGKPHPQMLEVAVPLLRDVQEMMYSVFCDLEVAG